MSEFGPSVADEVFFLRAAAHQDVEVVHPFSLPARLERLREVRVGRRVVTHVDRRGRALEDVDLLCVASQVGHGLDRRRAGADHADALVGELREAARRVAAGVLIVPAARMERMPLEFAESRNAGQLRLRIGAVGHTDEPCADPVVPGRCDGPSLRRFVPIERAHLGLEEGAVVEVVVSADRLGVGKDLGAVRVLLGGDGAEFLEQRHVDVRFHVALDPRVAIPIPGAAEIPARFDDSEIFDTGLAESHAHQKPAEAAADDHNLDFFFDRRAREARLHIGIDVVVRAFAHKLAKLRGAVRRAAACRAPVGTSRALRRDQSPSRGDFPRPV